MKDKILNLLKSKLFFAIVINIVIMLFCIGITSFSYDSPDDFYNSLYICHHNYYYSNKINYIFSTIIGSVQFILTNFNCFVLSQILLSCSAFTAISYVLADKFGKNKALVFTLLLNILFALDHYAGILSSKTSALLIAAGFLLALNAIRNKRYNLPFWLGLCEILLGSFLCFEYFLVGLVFAAAFFFGDMIAKRKYKLPFRKFFWYFRPFVLVFVFIFLLGIGAEHYSFSVNHSSAEVSDYYKYSELCDSINQYPFPNYFSYEEEFSNIGITSASDYDLLINGYYDSENHLNNDALSLIAKIQKDENPYNIFADISNISYDFWMHISNFDFYALIYIVFTAIAVIYVIIQKKRFAFFPVFYLTAAFFASLFIRYKLNSSAYTMYGIWLMLCLFLIYSFDFENLKKTDRTLLKNKKSKLLLSIVVLLFITVSYSVIYQTHYQGISYDRKPSNLYTEINRHPERYYVLDPVSADKYIKYTDNYTHPLWGFKRSFMDNVDGFGYFHQQSQLLKHNLPMNIYRAVLTNNEIFVIDNNITYKKEKYFSRHYIENNKAANYKKVKEINGFKIYSVEIM